jgi:hypothetical protein
LSKNIMLFSINIKVIICMDRVVRWARESNKAKFDFNTYH